MAGRRGQGGPFSPQDLLFGPGHLGSAEIHANCAPAGASRCPGKNARRFQPRWYPCECEEQPRSGERLFVAWEREKARPLRCEVKPSSSEKGRSRDVAEIDSRAGACLFPEHLQGG